jgi:cytochrome c-type biogenesis protein CcmF
VRIDGSKVYRPAVSNYSTTTVGTPSVESRAGQDIYLTLQQVPTPGQTAVVIGVIVEPLVSWIWVGGGVIVAGSALAAFPGRRRRKPTDPVSTPPGPPAATSAVPAEAVVDVAAPDDVPVGVGG